MVEEPTTIGIRHGKTLNRTAYEGGMLEHSSCGDQKEGKTIVHRNIFK